MESYVRFSLSPIVSRASLLSSSTSKALTSSGQRHVFEFLERRRLQYLVRQVKMKSSAARKDNGGGAESVGGGVPAPIHAERYYASFEKAGKSSST